ncbi:MAG: hypothetical protein ABSG64_01745 [Solirubrobacteraceae bacterium]|jgi:hypothetical protein
MRSARIKPEYGPMLPELFAARLAGLPRHLRGVLAGAALVCVLVVAFVLAARGSASFSHRADGVSFSFSYVSLQQAATPPGQYVLAVKRRDGQVFVRFEVGPLTLPSYSGEISGLEPVMMANYIRAFAARTPGFLLASEGRTRVNAIPGYDFTYRRVLDGTRYYGRVIFLTPQLSGDRHGLILSMLVQPVLGAVADPDAVGEVGVLSEVLATFSIAS